MSEHITATPVAGDYTLSCGGNYARYSHDNKLLDTSEPAVNWALNWANAPIEKRTCCDSTIDTYHRDNCELPGVLRARDFNQPDQPVGEQQ